MKKFYYYIYYQIYHFSIKISDDALNEIKPGVTIIILELLVVTQLFIWLKLFQLISKRVEDLLWSKPILVTIVLLIILFNYFLFLHKEKWGKYDKEFRNYPKSKKRLWNFTIILVIIGVLTGFIFAFYMFYQT